MVASPMPARKLPPPGEEEEDYGSETSCVNLGCCDVGSSRLHEPSVATLGSRFRRAITLSFGMALAAWPGILHSNLSTVGVCRLPSSGFSRARVLCFETTLCSLVTASPSCGRIGHT